MLVARLQEATFGLVTPFCKRLGNVQSHFPSELNIPSRGPIPQKTHHSRRFRRVSSGKILGPIGPFSNYVSKRPALAIQENATGGNVGKPSVKAPRPSRCWFPVGGELLLVL